MKGFENRFSIASGATVAQVAVNSQMVSGMQILDYILAMPEEKQKQLMAAARGVFRKELNPHHFYLREDFDWFTQLAG